MDLLVDRRGATVALERGRVVVLRYPDGTQHRVGVEALRSLIVHGEAQLSSGLLRACQEHGVAVTLHPARGPAASIALLPWNRGQLNWRRAQHRCYSDPVCRLALAKTLVRAKLIEQGRVLGDGEATTYLAGRVASLSQADDLGAVRGIEGAAAARYFQAWRGTWAPSWGFERRQRRPPPDPINALLSLAYTLADHWVGRLAVARGLDPGIGFLHGAEGNRPNLALDLLEPLRPWVDWWVWRFVYTAELTPEDFTSGQSGGCRLKADGRQAFYRHWYGGASSWLEGHARRSLARVLRHLKPWIETRH